MVTPNGLTWRIRRILRHVGGRFDFEDDCYDDRAVFDRFERRQPIRMARRGNIGQGNLYVGRIRDAGQFRDGLVLHFGHDAVPLDLEKSNNVVVRRHIMSDGSNTVQDWLAWLALIELGAECIRRGTNVLCTCDAGVSRSTTSAASIVAYIEDVPMNYHTLAHELRNKQWDGVTGEFLPSERLWSEARVALDVLREWESGEAGA